MKIKALEFFKVSEKLPTEKCDCMLVYRSDGLTSDQYIGVMPYFPDKGYWMDVLATPEAGAMWDPKQDDVQKYGWWAKWEEEA